MTDDKYIQFCRNLETRDTIKREFNRASEQYPPFHSLHEGYAVLLEEIEELAECVEAIRGEVCRMWRFVREDEKKGACYQAGEVYNLAKAAITEAAQVGAMAHKFTRIMNFEKFEENGGLKDE